MDGLYHSVMRFVRFWLLVCAAVLLLSTGSAQAHSEVFERAPALGQVVTGDVDHVDISFFLPVTESSISLVDPDGNEIAVTEAELATNGQITSVEFEPLSVEGRYTVNHVETSIDGDVQEGTFSFIFNSTEGEEIASLIARNTGPNWVLLVFLTGVIMFLAGTFWPGRTRRS